MKSTKTWILVAHRAGASLYERLNTEKNLDLIEDVVYPEGKLKGRALDADRPGRSMSDASKRRYPFDDEKSSEKQNEKKFAKRLAQMVNRGALNKKFDQLVLVAGPHLLGLLRSDLDKRTSSRVIREFGSDLGRLKKNAQEQTLLGMLAKR